MKNFEDMSASEVQDIVKSTLKMLCKLHHSNDKFSDQMYDTWLAQHNIPSMLREISEIFFKNLSAGRLSPLSNEDHDALMICSKSFVCLSETGVYFKTNPIGELL